MLHRPSVEIVHRHQGQPPIGRRIPPTPFRCEAFDELEVLGDEPGVMDEGRVLGRAHDRRTEALHGAIRNVIPHDTLHETGCRRAGKCSPVPRVSARRPHTPPSSGATMEQGGAMARVVRGAGGMGSRASVPQRSGLLPLASPTFAPDPMVARGLPAAIAARLVVFPPAAARPPDPLALAGHGGHEPAPRP